MTLAIDTVDGCGLSNKVHRELLPKKTKIILAIHLSLKEILLAIQYKQDRVLQL